LGPRADLVTLQGELGPDRVRQGSAHPHDTVFDPSGRFLAVPDLGLDRIFVLRLDATSGKLTLNDPPSVATRKRAGPRHIAFHAKMPFAYVVNELDSTVATYRFDPQRGSLQAIQVLPTTPSTYTGELSSSEVAVTPNGRFVYVSNRCNNSIASFAVDQSAGTLTPMGWAPTNANSPRFFCLDPAAKFLYAANADEGFGPPGEKNTDTIVQFDVQADGALKPTGQVIKTNSPCTIVFASA
jgi:6-phosphogluconolactonase